MKKANGRLETRGTPRGLTLGTGSDIVENEEKMRGKEGNNRYGIYHTVSSNRGNKIII